MAYKATFVGPRGVKLYIDHGDVDTPAIVEWQKHTATYYCAMDTGELDCGAGPDLLPEQLTWLEEFEGKVDEAFSVARAGMKEYGN